MQNKNVEKNIIELKKEINGKTVVIKCEEFFKEQGIWLLNMFDQEHKEVNIIRDGFKIQAGFTMYLFKEVDGEIKVLAPDYSKNPMKDTTDNLSLSLILQLQQNSILKKLKIDGEQIAFDDKIVMLKEAKNSDNIYLERAKEYTKGDSGWYIGVIDNDKAKAPDDAEEYESIYAYEVLRFRPDFIQLLALPKGYLVAIIDNEIKEISDGENNVAYRKR